MKKYRITIKGVSPMSHNRPVMVEKMQRETHDDYEKRTWKERLNHENGYVIIPAMAVKNALSEAAKFISLQIPGKGKSTYTKHFEAGIMVAENWKTNVKPEDVTGEAVFVPSDGKKGSASNGTRVWKTFPYIKAGWTATGELYVLDEAITKDVLERHFREAGLLIGFGRFRPRNGGMYGRYELIELKEVSV